MTPSDMEKRIASIEKRLAGIESRLGDPARQPQAAAAVQGAARVSPPASKKAEVQPPVAKPKQENSSSLVTNILGWGGAVAFLLAASYLIRLAIDIGWLTPVRQITIAAIFGLLLIGTGFTLRNLARQYAGLLPAVGIVILFLSIYGGHLYYGIIEMKAAATAVIVVCALSLWLCRAFESDLYALFAVVGSYSAPFLLSGLRGNITDVVIYYSAWSIVFGIYAIWQERRLIYLLALYLALIGFDIICRVHVSGGDWFLSFSFQTAQFIIFGIATAMFSIIHSEALDSNTALAHLPPLLLFYFLQYAMLCQHLPSMAPWIAFVSLLFLAGLYFVARLILAEPLPGGELLLWCYLSLVLFHAGYLETIPKQWAPWVAFLLVPVVAFIGLRRIAAPSSSWPLWIVVGIMFSVNYLRVVFHTDLHDVPGVPLLSVGYAALLYLGYHLIRGRQALNDIDVLLLYTGHICSMAVAYHILPSSFITSIAWGILALGCLGVSLLRHDRILGQSSLFVFGATAAKVMIFDLNGAPPIARIVSLVVLGATFYIGGMLYQRLLWGDAKGQAV